MLKNKDFKSKKLGDYNKVIITRGMEFSELGNYSLENKKNFEKLKNKLELSTGKKLQEVVAFGEGEGVEIVDAERDEFQKDYYNDVVIMKDSSAFAVYSEFNAPICTRIQQNDIIVSLVNNRGDKVICKLDINKIENLSKIVKYEFDRGYVINVPKLICDILFEYKVSSDIQIIKNEEEDINNLMLFI